MNGKREIINTLLKELYMKKYRERVTIKCKIEDNQFKHYITRDWRFLSLYGSYVEKSGNKISIDEFFEQELNNLFKFVNECLLRTKQENIYIDEEYNFYFEIFGFGVPSFDDYLITENTRNMRKLGKKINEMSSDEIYDKFIADIKAKIKVIDDRDKAANRLTRTEHIKKVNEQKKKHLIVTDKIPKKYSEYIGKEFESVNDAAEKMNVTRMTVSRWLKNEILKSVK